MQALLWNDLQDFLAIAHAGKLARAASAIGVDATTMGRRLRRLESRLGQTLFEQTRTGQVLTDAGERLLAQAEAMQSIADRIAATPSGESVEGLVRMSASEGFGTWFIARHLPDLARRHPGLMVDLAATTGFLSPSKRETDLAVLLARPRAGPVIASKLSDYALRLYCSQAYLKASGPIRRSAELPDRDFVGYIPELIYAPELRYLDEFDPPPHPKLRSSSINAQHRLIAGGAGIGVLPCFIGDADPTLSVVLPEHRMIRSFWLVTHKDTHQLKRIRTVKDWLVEVAARHRHVFLPD
ncbi:MAG: LysR family transcriptional regulator [Pseudomonadota bacterium]